MQPGLVLCLLLVAVAWSKPVEDDKGAASVDAVDSATKLTGKSDKSSGSNAAIGSFAEIKPDTGKIPSNADSMSVAKLPSPSPGAPDSSDKLDPDKLDPDKATSIFASPDSFAKPDAFASVVSKMEKTYSSSSFFKETTKEELNNDRGTSSSNAEGIANAIDKKKISISKTSDVDTNIDKKPTLESLESTKKNTESEKQAVSNNKDSLSGDTILSDDEKGSATINKGNKDSKKEGIGSALPDAEDKGYRNRDIYSASLSKTDSFSFF